MADTESAGSKTPTRDVEVVLKRHSLHKEMRRAEQRERTSSGRQRSNSVPPSPFDTLRDRAHQEVRTDALPVPIPSSRAFSRARVLRDSDSSLVQSKVARKNWSRRQKHSGGSSGDDSELSSGGLAFCKGKRQSAFV